MNDPKRHVLGEGRLKGVMYYLEGVPIAVGVVDPDTKGFVKLDLPKEKGKRYRLILEEV